MKTLSKQNRKHQVVADKIYLTTFSGKKIDPTDMQPSDVCIEDIAHALSNQCRYGGHTNRFFSVAEHCLLVVELMESYELSLNIKRQGLLHDSTEYVMCDIPTPFKQLVPEYGILENKIYSIIAKHFNLPSKLDPIVKSFDIQALKKEMSILLPHDNFDGLTQSYHTMYPKIWGYSPEEAKDRFMEKAVILRLL